ncbi:MAG TPA: response regulator transcription factor [Chthoniobacteraceae bacterium]|nr:response regulator transcription factor [Chthoniobacteraceae bacterium]
MPPRSPIRLLIVDDHSMVRMGLVTILGVEKDLKVVAEAEDAEQAVVRFRQYQPDVTLMDSRMPGGNGIDALKRIRQEFPGARVIMLTTFDLEEMVFTALEAGAAGYLLKSVERAELVAAIRHVHAGERCFPEALKRRMEDQGSHKRLSPRELETLELVRRGLSNRDIGVALGVTENTAKAHVKGILLKLGVADRAEAVAAGFERGLLQVGDQ